MASAEQLEHLAVQERDDDYTDAYPHQCDDRYQMTFNDPVERPATAAIARRRARNLLRGRRAHD